MQASSRRQFMKHTIAWSAGATCFARSTLAYAIDLTVTHFGQGMYGVPFAVAKDKGWFKEMAGLDVSGFITSAGGGTTIRNALAWTMLSSTPC